MMMRVNLDLETADAQLEELARLLDCIWATAYVCRHAL